MKYSTFICLMLIAGFIIPSCNRRPVSKSGSASTDTSSVIMTGAGATGEYLNLISDKQIGIVANQTSMVGTTHLVDTLLSLGVKIKTIFAPEHGFRNLADAGDVITDGKDPLTGIRIVSLYGSHMKPDAGNLEGLDAVIFDVQDVGTRFYTYISTMSLLMESCAENNVELIILDRPNPNGFYFDGNILDTAYSSFVGMHPVPVVHGMTVGEYAGMVNGEGWLKGGLKCDLTVIRCRNYYHSSYYNLPVKPSPNLPNQNSVYLYPSLCFFEGTVLSCGRGTDAPFQMYGAPAMPDRGFSFVPQSMPGARNPLHMGKTCYGTDLRQATEMGIVPSPQINLEWIINAYNDYPDKKSFFTRYFDTLAGGPRLREQIISGMTAGEIRASWAEGLKIFGETRKKYLLYGYMKCRAQEQS